ncbi:MAG: hypothetical protein GTO60_02180, partial [Gammaproteobacteria bacterium]|nr:hypothetical protein [Gammaproteobacteria bacterium]
MNSNKSLYRTALIVALLTLMTFVHGLNAQSRVSSDVLEAVQKLPSEMVSWADTVLYNGHIVTMDDAGISASPGSIVEAMALKDGFIMKVGGDGEVKLLIGPDTRVMDLKGRTVLPGLIDTHAHPGPDATGLNVGQPGIHTAMLV